MSSIHYKFRNSKDYATITFDGAYISLGELKKEICKREYGKVTDIDLKVVHAQTNEGKNQNCLFFFGFFTSYMMGFVASKRE